VKTYLAIRYRLYCSTSPNPKNWWIVSKTQQPYITPIGFAIHGQVSFDKAVANSKTLISAAEEANIRRIVHISITNPSEGSPFPYFSGKALVEKAIIQSKLSYAIIRPTVIFGLEGILINNIAWLLRKFPIFFILCSLFDGIYIASPGSTIFSSSSIILL